MKIFHCSFNLKLPTDENGCILNLHIVSQEYKKAEDPLRGPIDSAEYSSDFVFILQFQSPVVKESVPGGLAPVCLGLWGVSGG